jgi:hypothetical protein
VATETVKIGPYLLPVCPTQGTDESGSFHSDPCPYICLDAHMTGLQRPASLLHEALHAIDHFYGIGLSERDVRTLETALVQLIRDNPQLVEDLRR